MFVLYVVCILYVVCYQEITYNFVVSPPPLPPVLVGLGQKALFVAAVKNLYKHALPSLPYSPRKYDTRTKQELERICYKR